MWNAMSAICLVRITAAKGTRRHSAKLVKIKRKKDLIKRFFSRRVIEPWNQLDKHKLDASRISEA